MGQSMKYYVYVSDSKVDMLYDQLPRGFLGWLRGVNLSVGPVGGGITGKREATRFDRLRRVVSYLRSRGEVGTLDEPKGYVAGVLSMWWGPYGHSQHGNDGVVFFGGETERTILGLGGSMHHIIGNVAGPVIHSHSATPVLISALVEELQLPPSEWMYEGPLGPEELRQDESWERDVILAVELAERQHQGPPERLEFVAKVLLSGKARDSSIDDSEKKWVILGSPLYVARAD
jgi:hypothetical protein